ncbi:MAG TPA: chemotaxis response regulator protein-glutamate methylesterase [Tepidisphaeraceae bacterium]|nr:chemotaxis response regulator protein-glutamate methylesterase [Tepidisphaeraceae bacterium]
MNAAAGSTHVPQRRIRVLIVDDSAIVRQVLQRLLGSDPQIEVVATAHDAYVAREKIVRYEPDVVTLDVNMPRMDGITFLRKLMAHHPVPVIVVSGQTSDGTATALEALCAGAVDLVSKPAGEADLAGLGSVLIDKIKSAARARVKLAPAAVVSSVQADACKMPRIAPAAAANQPASGPSDPLIFAIGASTGGVQALTEVLTAFPEDAPPTLIVQHMPAKFTGPFAQRLNKLCRVEIREAANGDRLSPGTVLIAPGGFHMTLRRRAGGFFGVEVRDGPELFHQKPSVEVLFNSVAKAAGANAVGAILTGMGADGAQGLLRMRQAGAFTLAQDEASCVVFGMPCEAIKCGAAHQVVPLTGVADAMMAAAQRHERGGSAARVPINQRMSA